MWTMLLFLWSVPLAAAILIFVRVAEGSPALTEHESELFLGDSKEITLSPWLVLEFVLIALIFFMLGVFEGLILANFGTAWSVVVPLMTGAAAMGMVAYRLRSAPHATRVTGTKTAPATARQNRVADLFTRWSAYKRR
jgi:hypothetical protein